MKNKVIALSVLTALIMPAISQAVIFVPTANLTIVINTQGQDDSFHVNLKNTNPGDPIRYDYNQFDLQTENLTVSQFTSVVTFGSTYYLSQDSVQGLKIKDINCVSDNPLDSITYNLDMVIFTPINNENITCIFDNVKNIGKTPVLIVPGLIGTDLMKGNSLLWMNPQQLFISPSDSFMDPLSLGLDLTPSDANLSVGDIIKNKTFNLGAGNIVVFSYADGLIAELKNQGYAENETLFTFPYDWRYGVTGKYTDGKTNVDLLQQKIADIMVQAGSDKVDVIAHSMGGLIVKKYAMDNSASHHIGKAIFVGVPSTGAPYAVKDLLVGDNFDSYFVSQVEMKKISENMPAIYDLLPSQQYYNNKGSYVKIIDQGFTGLNTTTKDLTHSEVNSFLTSDHGLNNLAVNNAESLHTAIFDNFDLRTAGIDLYAIDGCKAGTLGKVIEVRSKSLLRFPVIDYRKPEIVPGDGTVPLESATNLPIDADHKYYALTNKNSLITGEDKISVHGHLLSGEGTRQQIVNLISGSNLAVSDKVITQDISKCQLNGKAISVFSPIDIFVTDQNGNREGIDADGNIINEIPNAYFEVWGEHKFLYLPTDDGQVYDVKIKGTGAGTYTINSQNISGGQVTGTEVFSNLPVTTALAGSVNLGTQTTLTVQQNLGSAPQTILPSAVLNAVQSEDVLPPVSKITLSGKQDKNGNYKEEVEIKIISRDVGTGILNMYYGVDGSTFKKINKDKVEFEVEKKGSHVVQFFATDKAGNNEVTGEVKFTIKKDDKEKDKNDKKDKDEHRNKKK